MLLLEILEVNAVLETINKNKNPSVTKIITSEATKGNSGLIQKKKLLKYIPELSKPFTMFETISKGKSSIITECVMFQTIAYIGIIEAESLI